MSMYGFRLQMRDLPKYKGEGEEDEKEEEADDVEETQAISTEFSDKTNQLLDYIEKTYLKV